VVLAPRADGPATHRARVRRDPALLTDLLLSPLAVESG
jgi:hypothetical protein